MISGYTFTNGHAQYCNNNGSLCCAVVVAGRLEMTPIENDRS